MLNFDIKSQMKIPKKFFLLPLIIFLLSNIYASNVSANVYVEDLEKSMREMLDRYADAGKISQIEEDIILNAWLDWARRNLNKMKFK